MWRPRYNIGVLNTQDLGRASRVCEGLEKLTKIYRIIETDFYVYILVRKMNGVSYGNTTKMDPGTNPQQI